MLLSNKVGKSPFPGKAHDFKGETLAGRVAV